ncbi:MAG TPA: hypothetical protein VI685_07305 [Candidatus Angelobacter sp.]
MIQTLVKNWWLILLRGVLALLFSAAAFLMQSSADTFTLREFAMKGMVVFFGMLALVAGACTAAAGIWRATTGKWWLLLWDGVIVSSAGFLLVFANRFSLWLVTQVVVVLAAAIGIIELAIARSLRRHVPDEWFLALAGVASLAFAVLFLVLKPEEPRPLFIWLGSYSGFSAICMLALAFRLRGLRASIHRMAQSASQGQ